MGIILKIRLPFDIITDSIMFIHRIIKNLRLLCVLTTKTISAQKYAGFSCFVDKCEKNIARDAVYRFLSCIR
jgi:hypothetical protein